jgi:hypothetical protein
MLEEFPRAVRETRRADARVALGETAQDFGGTRMRAASIDQRDHMSA